MKITRAFAIGLACIVAVDAYQFSLGWMLRHPGELFFPIEIPAILTLGLIPLGLAIRALVHSIKALSQHLSPRTHLFTFFGLVAVLSLPLFLGASFYRAGVWVRIKSAGEMAYMSLAKDTRAMQQKHPGLFTKPDYVADESVGEREQRKLTFLEAILSKDSPVAAHWPRTMLHVTVEDTHIRIARGSGMLGQLGVVILDQSDTLKLYSPKELAGNPYLPHYTQITDRLYMFESD